MGEQCGGEGGHLSLKFLKVPENGGMGSVEDANSEHNLV